MLSRASGHEGRIMKITIKVRQPPCVHRALTLQGLNLTYSIEHYTCKACGEHVVHPLKTSVSYWLAPGHQV